MFGLLLTDNGTEFADGDSIERSVSSDSSRCEVYYCDVH